MLKQTGEMITQTLTPEELSKVIHRDYQEMLSRAQRKAAIRYEDKVGKEQEEKIKRMPPYSTKAPSGLRYKIIDNLISMRGKAVIATTIYIPYLTKNGYGAMINADKRNYKGYYIDTYQWFTPHFFDRYRERRNLEGKSKLEVIDLFFESNSGIVATQSNLNLKEYPDAMAMALQDGGMVLGEKKEGGMYIGKTYLSPTEIKEGQEKIRQEMEKIIKLMI